MNIPVCHTCRKAPAGNDAAGEWSAYCAECQPWKGKTGVGDNTTDHIQKFMREALQTGEKSKKRKS